MIVYDSAEISLFCFFGQQRKHSSIERIVDSGSIFSQDFPEKPSSDFLGYPDLWNPSLHCSNGRGTHKTVLQMAIALPHHHALKPFVKPTLTVLIENKNTYFD